MYFQLQKALTYLVPIGFQRTVGKVYPPPLMHDDFVPTNEYFKTTTGTTHDYKEPGGILSQQPLYKKAPGSWNVKYVEDNIAKVHNSFDYNFPFRLSLARK